MSEGPSNGDLGGRTWVLLFMVALALFSALYAINRAAAIAARVAALEARP